MPRTVEGTRRVKCSDCSTEMVLERGDRRTWCFDCGLRRLAGTGEQMRAKAGPQWEAAVRGQLRYWTAEAKRLGLTP